MDLLPKDVVIGTLLQIAQLKQNASDHQGVNDTLRKVEDLIEYDVTTYTNASEYTKKKYSVS